MPHTEEGYFLMYFQKYEERITRKDHKLLRFLIEALQF